MRRLIWRASVIQRTVAGLLFCGTLAVLGTVAQAGLFHTQESGACQDCHKAGLTKQEPVLIASLITPVPRPSSFGRMDVNRTCLECHSEQGGDGKGTSVLAGGDPAIVRQAGYLNGPGGFGHTGHTLGSTQAAPGGTWAPGPQGLTCTDCHDPHGDTGQYRNLVLRPGTAKEDRRVTFVIGPANDRRKDVWVQSGSDGPGKYHAVNVRFNQPRPGRSAYGEWCQGCHTAFHGPAGSPNMGGQNGWKRHPSADARIGGGPRQHSSLARYAALGNRVPTLSATGSWPASDNTPSCMSCHKAHGNGNPFGLLYMAGQGQLTESGDSQGRAYVDLCHQCHTQGLPPQLVSSPGPVSGKPHVR